MRSSQDRDEAVIELVQRAVLDRFLSYAYQTLDGVKEADLLQFDSQGRQTSRRGIMTSKGCDRLFHGDSSFLMGNYFSFPLGMGLHPPFGKLFGTSGTTATNLDQI